MSLASAIAEYTGTPEEILAQLKQRTVPQLGQISGAALQQVVLENGLLAFVRDKAAAVGDYSAIRNMCIALSDRMTQDMGIDFSKQNNSVFLSAFLAEPEVAAILAAQGKTSTDVEDAIAVYALKQEPEFPSVTLRDVLLVVSPELVAESVSNAIPIKGISQSISVTLAADLPEAVTLQFEVTHDGTLWLPLQMGGNVRAHLAGQYVVRALPGPLFAAESQVRVKLPYNIAVVIA